MEVDDEVEDGIEEMQNKNPNGLNSSEIIAALSLEFLRISEHFYNPISKKPFHLKFGKTKLSTVNSTIRYSDISSRFSFGYGYRWYCWLTKLSILSIWRYCWNSKCTFANDQVIPTEIS